MIKELFLGVASLANTEANALPWNANLAAADSVIYSSASRENSLVELSKIDMRSIDYRVEFQEVILPKFLANKQKLVALM
ncbi:hypothetical protein HYZ82_00720, partial [Candidatus Nomurabacteria bacterium]|nr:hypothetical protein [Candidatus Nomurabacteria bacterium]